MAVTAAACRSGEPPAEAPAAAPSPAWSIDSARVVFAAARGGPPDIYVLDRATGMETRVTSYSTLEGGANGPRLSQDGSRLAFQVRRGTDYEIWVRDLSTGRDTNLTGHPEYDVSPVWSPDGTRLAFMSTRGFELGTVGPFPGHIYVADLAGGPPTVVTRSPLTSSFGPTDWSADGTRLLLARLVAARPVVVELDLVAGGERRLTTGVGGSEYSAAYSRSGDRIAFHAEADEESHIVVARLDGSERRVLTAGPGLRYNPRWSPNDEWILFTVSDDGLQYDLRAVRVSDGQLLDLVVTAEDEREGDWWPAPT